MSKARKRTVAVLGAMVVMLVGGYLVLSLWFGGGWNTNPIDIENRSAQILPRAVLLIPDSTVVADFRSLKPGASAQVTFEGANLHACEIYCELADGSRKRLDAQSACNGVGTRIRIVFEANSQVIVDGKLAVPSSEPVEYLHLPG